MDIQLVIVLCAAGISVSSAMLLLRALILRWPSPGKRNGTLTGPLWRVIQPVVEWLEPVAALTLSRQGRRKADERLGRAGLSGKLSAIAFRSAQLWVALLGSALAAAMASVLTLRGDFVLIPCASLVGLFVPVLWLRWRTRLRLELLRRQLPFLMELVAMSVDSGLPIGAALSQAVDRAPGGPLREEFQRAIGEMKAGRSREESLTALSERIGQPALTQFVLALIAIQRDGGSVIHLLKTLADQQRTDRLLRAEHLAMQAPVKLMVPLVVFIFPGTFAILLYPVIARMFRQGGLW
jgi:tight adherence protein C